MKKCTFLIVRKIKDESTQTHKYILQQLSELCDILTKWGRLISGIECAETDSNYYYNN